MWHWNVIGIRENYQIRMCTKQKGMQSKFQRPKDRLWESHVSDSIFVSHVGKKKTLFDRIHGSVS